MNNKKKTAVIIAAAGTGKRMGSSIPKQYLKIGGEPILLKSIRAFCDNKEIDWIVVVTNGDYIQACLEMKDRYGLDKIQAVIEGGEERQDSVYRAIVEIDRLCPEIEYVLVHDGARPFVRQETINAVLEAAEEKGAAVACVPVKDSIRQEKDGESAFRGSVCTLSRRLRGFKKKSSEKPMNRPLRMATMAPMTLPWRNGLDRVWLWSEGHMIILKLRRERTCRWKAEWEPDLMCIS